MPSSSMQRWQGRVALVTGASSGIGRAVARTLAAQGMRVVVAARRAERLNELAEELAPLGTEVLAHACDLRDERQVLALSDAARKRFGGVDALINNAGVGRSAPLMSASSEPWRQMLELNVLALCVCTREGIKDMQRRGDQGHVIHISSMSGYRVTRGSGVYAASKFALRALTEALRQELRQAGSAIRVSSISPGFVETEFAELYHGRPEAARETYGRFKVLQPEDLADAVRYVLAAPVHVQVHDILLRPTEQDT